jgi:hypothetical protein
MSWIEAKSTVEIALFVFSIAYLAAAIIFCLVASLSRRSVAKDLKAIVPVSLTTPLGVILGLLIAFHASRVWTTRAGSVRLPLQDRHYGPAPPLYSESGTARFRSSSSTVSR